MKKETNKTFAFFNPASGNAGSFAVSGVCRSAFIIIIISIIISIIIITPSGTA